jgi:TonB family protein
LNGQAIRRATSAWNQWEGHVINGTFHLRRYLGGCETSAVFLTEHGKQDPRRAAIKIIPASLEDAELQLSQWDRAAKLSHPHLIQLLQMGHCELGGMELLFLVMEYAEENLSEVLPQRSLTPEETSEMLGPVVDALNYVHSQGFVHGHIKPANIMGVDDQLKISADGLSWVAELRSGLRKESVYDAPEIADGEISPAADVWSLGMTLVETLTQRLPVWQQFEAEPVLPEALPIPFFELAGHCLCRDIQHRWTLAEIAAHLPQTSLAPANQTSTTRQAVRGKQRYVVPALAVGAVLVAMLMVPRFFNRHPETRRPISTVIERPAVPSNPIVSFVPGLVMHEVVPDVPRTARNTISGTVKVIVRVHVDASGGVVKAKLDSRGPSKYFARLALQAARGWKFTPPKVDGRDVSSEWRLRFEFRNSGTKAFSTRFAAR